MSYENYLAEYAKIGYGPHAIRTISNFLPLSDIDLLCDYIRGQEEQTVSKEDISDAKIIEILSLHEQKALEASREIYTKEYGVKISPISPDWSHLTKWDMLTGYTMNVHSDSETPDGKPAIRGGYYRHNITTIVYLTDNYVGGQLCFPEFDLCLQPSVGDMILFPSRYKHNISLLESGERYTMPMHFTFDVEDNIDQRLTEITDFSKNPSDILFFGEV